MLKITLRGILAHKFRLISTFIAVLLGVSFMASSFVLTDTISSTFKNLFGDANADTDVIVRKVETFDPGQTASTGRGRVPDSLLPTIRQVDGVAGAEGQVGPGYAQYLDKDGDPIGDPTTGAPTLGFNWSSVQELNPFVLVEGTAPEGPTQLVMDRGTAEDNDFAVGDDVVVLTQTGRHEATVVGIASFGDADNLAGATAALFDTETAQEFVGVPGKFENIGVVGEDGVSQDQLVERISQVLPNDVEAISGADFTAEQQDLIEEQLSFFNIFLLVFALIALAVGIFIIYNTFTIIVAQRTRELALVRAIGAGPSQVLWAVILEAFVVGLVASLTGVVAGIGLAKGLQALFGAIGFELPPGPTVIQAADMVWAVVAGVVITLIASIVPSVQAARIPPIAAMRAVAVERHGRLVVRRVVGGLMLGLGILLVVFGLFTSGGNAGLRVGFGAAFIFLAVAVLTPLFARPLSGLIGWPLPRLRGISGTLARENAMRNPRRTSTTAGALMIGIALVGFITIFGDSAKASIDDTIDRSFVGDFAVTSGSFGFSGLPPDVADQLNDLDEVSDAAGLRFTTAQINFGREQVQGVDPERMFQIVDIGVIAGDPADLDEDGIALHVDQANENGLDIGDTVVVTFPDTGPHDYQVAVVYEDNDALDVQNPTDYILGFPAYEKAVDNQFDTTIYVALAEGVTPDRGRAAIETVTDDFPTAKVQDQSELKKSQGEQIDQFLIFVNVLLLLAIIIAGIGIMNTLALSVYERTHELGLLRAVGAYRRQVRSAIRWEAVIIALLGAFLGLVIGVFFGWILVQALKDEGFTVFHIPVGRLVLITLTAALLGVISAIPPTIRASRLNVLEAIEHE